MGSSWYLVNPSPGTEPSGVTLDDIKARIRREPLVVAALIVPFLTLLIQLGIGVPAAAVAGVQTFITTVAVVFARGKVTPVVDARNGEANAYVEGHLAGYADATEASCP